MRKILRLISNYFIWCFFVPTMPNFSLLWSYFKLSCSLLVTLSTQNRSILRFGESNGEVPFDCAIKCKCKSCRFCLTRYRYSDRMTGVPKSDNTNSPNDAEDWNLKWHEHALDYPSWGLGLGFVPWLWSGGWKRQCATGICEVVLNVSRQISLANWKSTHTTLVFRGEPSKTASFPHHHRQSLHYCLLISPIHPDCRRRGGREREEPLCSIHRQEGIFLAPTSEERCGGHCGATCNSATSI